METQIKPLHEQLRLNSRLFVNCLAGVDDRTARSRINARTNNIAFIASHIIDARYFLARLLGVRAQNPFRELLEGLRSIEEFTEFPVVREVLASWEEVSALLAERFDTLSAEDLQEASPQSFPIEDGTVLGAIAFLVQHESYHIGQLGLLRKCFDLKAMTYADPA